MPSLSSQFAVAGNIIKKDGFLALYKGLDAGLLRQATYTTARLGIFNNLSAALKDMNGGQVCGWAHAWRRARISAALET